MIRLTRIVLVNWYAFTARDVDLRGSAAIIGPNGAGKSSLLDAVQVVLTGNNRNSFRLNSSSNVTSGTGRAKRSDDNRSVFSYCLGKVHGETLRKECISYLALVFEREHDGQCWTVGLGLSARDEDSEEETLGAFIAPGQSLRAQDFLVEVDGGRRPLDYDELIARLRRTPEFDNHGARPVHFTQAILRHLKGRIGAADANRYIKTLKNALRFKAMDSASDFVRGFILEDDRLNIEELRGSIQRWRRFQEQIAELEERETTLLAIIKDYQELLGRQDDVARYAWIAAHAECERINGILAGYQREQGGRAATLDALTADLRRLREARASIASEIAEIEAALRTNNKELAIESSRLRLREAEKELRGAEAAHAASLARFAVLPRLRDRIAQLHAEFETGSALLALEPLISRLDGTAGPVQAGEIDRLAGASITPLAELLDRVAAVRNRELGEIANARRDHQQLTGELEALKSGRPILQRSTAALIDLLSARGIEAVPLLAVIDIADEAWRDAAETLLGPAREALIVPPARAREAMGILRAAARDLAGAQIVNTTKTATIDPLPRSTSLAAIIETTDEHARAFVNRRLGNVLRVETEDELLRADRGITRECVYATGGAIEVRHQARMRLIGKNVQARNRDIIEERASTLTAFVTRSEKENGELSRLIDDIQALTRAIGDDIGLAELEARVAAAANIKYSLDDNIRTLTSERPVEVREKLEGLKRDLADYRTEEDDVERQERVAIAALEATKAKIERFEEELATARSVFDDADALSDELRAHAGRTYAELLTQHDNAPAVRNAAQERQRAAANRAQALRHSAPAKAYQYARDSEVEGFVPDDSIEQQLGWLGRELEAIRANQLRGYKQQAAKAREAVEQSLRSDLLVKLYTKLENARSQIRDLNRMLKPRLFHRERYEFEVRADPAFADIVNVAKRIYDNNLEVSTLFANDAQLEDDLAHGVARIQKMLDGNEDVTEISDYRNYLRFELVTRTDDGRQSSTYSARQSSGSGGERQVPYYLAIATAIAATCHHRETTREHMGLGLVLFDEAFNALDGGNVSSCLGLMEEFNLQVIACAPTEKLTTFLEHMDTIVSVNRDGTHVQLDVEYPTRKGREMFRQANPANTPFEAFRETYQEQLALSDAAE